MLLQKFNNILFYSYITALFIVFLGIIIVIRFSKKITLPMGKLVGAMNEVQNGRLDAFIEDKNNINEISFVIRCFNHMTKQLNDLINTVYKEELILKEMKLKALQSQINPHFLFNTLQLISWKAREYDAKEICDMIYSLSYMLEVDLDAKEERYITIKNELEYMLHYAYIIKKKYENKITFKFDIPEDLKDVSIPKLLIQPFVENSVIHGLANKLGAGCVSVSAKKQEAALVFTIEDNGIGIRPEVLRSLDNGSGPANPDVGRNRQSIALDNIQRRVKMLYGEEYGFSIKSELYCGTTVTLKIPVESDKKDGKNQT